MPVMESRVYDSQIAELAEEFNLLPREKEVLLHLGTGKSNIEIADALELAERTVRVRYMTSIFRKLNCQSRSEVLGLIVERLTRQIESLAPM